MAIPKPALTQFLEKEFGGGFQPVLSNVVINTTASKVVEHNFERMGLTFVNLSTANIFLLNDASVSSTNGIELIGGGASLSIVARDDLVLPGWEWFAVGSSAPLNLLVIQVVRFRAGEA